MERLESTENLESAEQKSFDEILSEVDETHTSVLRSLKVTRPEAKGEFLSDPSLEHPNNTRDNLDPDDAVAKLNKIAGIESSLDTMEISDKQRQAIELSLEDNKQSNLFILACANYNENPSEEAREMYLTAGEALYGKPDEDTFWVLFNEDLEKARVNAEEQGMMNEYNELTGLIGEIKHPEVERFVPKSETVSRMHEMVEDFYGPLFEKIPEDKDEFTIEEAAEIANSIFAEFLPEDSKWHAVVSENATAASVSQETFTVSFPGRRALGNYDRQSLKRILVHEVGTHAMRGIPYEEAKSGMFRTGVPGYEEFEEGLAKVMEQAVDGEYSETPVPRLRYICSGLANYKCGNFRETFEIQKRLEHLAYGRKDTQVFDTVQRAYRGTDELPNNKDIVYYNGISKVWQYIEEHIDDPTLFDTLFLSGKTNFLIADHEKMSYEIKVNGI
ncbi:MAG: DUF1704 domain-containing protein [Candidatus Saccharibacteria bacterium]|nr:DUF1704 domain-containing protein [Candidatus Saccharibacteria bacterium]